MMVFSKIHFPKVNTIIAGWAVFFFVAALGIRLIGLEAMGNVWDEYFYYDASHEMVQNVQQRDFVASHWNQNFEHPPLGKYAYFPALVWNKVHHVTDNAKTYHAPRATSALLGSVLVVLIFLLGAKHFSLRTGIMAASIHALLPPFIAYSKIINLDVTMNLFFVASMYFFFDWVKTRATRPLWWAVIFAGLAIASKFNAVLILLVFFGTLLIDQWPHLRKTGSIEAPLPLVLAVPIAAVIMIAVWPWLWSETLAHFLQTLGHWSGSVQELFFGRLGEAPISYFVINFLIGTPLIILFLLIVGLIHVAQKRPREMKYWVLILWFLAPFSISLYHLRQDHLRYILTAFPAVELLAALGFWRLTDYVARGRKWVVATSVAFVVINLILVDITIHPYYLNYYNALVQGPRGVSRSHITDLGFYGEGIKEATEYVNRVAPDGATVHYQVVPDDAPYLDRPRLKRYDFPGADYIIFNANAILNHPKASIRVQTRGYHEVYTVRAGGAPMVWVYKKD